MENKGISEQESKTLCRRKIFKDVDEKKIGAIAPIGERVLVKPLTEPNNGIILKPEAFQSRSLVGLVVRAGSGCGHVIAGDFVLFAVFSGANVNMNVGPHKGCLMMNEDMVLALVENMTEEDFNG